MEELAREALFQGDFKQLAMILKQWQPTEAEEAYEAYLNFSGYLAIEQEDWKKAEVLYDSYVEKAKREKNWENYHVGLHQKAMVLREQGHLDAAQHLITEEAEILAQYFPNDDYRLAVNLYEQGYLALLQEDFIKAMPPLEKSLQLALTTDDLVLQGCSWRGIGQYHLAQGNNGNAQEALQQALQCFALAEDSLGSVGVRALLEQAALTETVRKEEISEDKMI